MGSSRFNTRYYCNINCRQEEGFWLTLNQFKHRKICEYLFIWLGRVNKGSVNILLKSSYWLLCLIDDRCLLLLCMLVFIKRWLLLLLWLVLLGCILLLQVVAFLLCMMSSYVLLSLFSNFIDFNGFPNLLPKDCCWKLSSWLLTHISRNADCVLSFINKMKSCQNRSIKRWSFIKTGLNYGI